MTQAAPRFGSGGYVLTRPYGTLGSLSAGSPTAGQIAGAAVGSATSIGTAIAAGASLTVPIIGAAFAAVALGIQAILNSGCGQSCIITSDWANQAESKLEQNLAEYFAIPAPRPASAQALALQNFDKVWAYLVQECSAPQLGTAGQNCISDRQFGACKWKADSAPQYPGQPALGTCWNWFSGYRNPIAQDPNVVSDAVYAASLQPPSSLQTSGAVSGSTGSSILGTTDSSSLLMFAGIGLLLFGLAGGNN